MAKKRAAACLGEKMKCLLSSLCCVLVGVSVFAQSGGECSAAGYYEGTVVSREAGELKVSLNLRCSSGSYVGELVTSVGTYSVIAGGLRDGHLVVTFTADSDKGTLEADMAGAKLRGKFRVGDDSGPVDLARVGEAKLPGSDAPRLDLTAAQWREDLHYFATEVPKLHPNVFYHLPRAQFDADVAQADKELEHITGDTAYVAIDRIA